MVLPKRHTGLTDTPPGGVAGRRPGRPAPRSWLTRHTSPSTTAVRFSDGVPVHLRITAAQRRRLSVARNDAAPRPGPGSHRTDPAEALAQQDAALLRLIMDIPDGERHVGVQLLRLHDAIYRGTNGPDRT